MNKNPRIILMNLAAVVTILLAGLGSPASAQYVISARGGLVNHTTGPVSYSTSSDPTWKEIPSRLQLDEGDRIKTEDWGKAELLLNPGSYLRIGNNAEVVMLSTDLAATAVELRSGSALLEVGNLPDKGAITVQTPVTRVRIQKDGLYRIDVASDAITLTVRQGEAQYLRADGTLEKVKKNRRALITAQSSQLAKFDPDHVDEFDLWSADRAELLVAANQSFIQRTRGWNWPTLLWSAWIYDPFYGCYTFFPYGYGFGSIYGFGAYWPWYYGGYGGGYGGGGYWTGSGQSGTSGPGGTPPTRGVKPAFTVRDSLSKGRERTVTFGRPRSEGGLDRSEGYSIHKSGGSLGGPVSGGHSVGYGGGVKSGGYSGTYSGGGGHSVGTSGGHVSGGGHIGGGKPK